MYIFYFVFMMGCCIRKDYFEFEIEVELVESWKIQIILHDE